MTGTAPLDITGRQAKEAAALDAAHACMLHESIELGADPDIVNAQLDLLVLAADRRRNEAIERRDEAAERLDVEMQAWLRAVRAKWCPESPT